MEGLLIWWKTCNQGFFSPTDPTMTLTNLTRLLTSVGNWELFSVYLCIPRSMCWDIRRQHPAHTDRVKGWCEWYISHHPAPSWLYVAGALYSAKEHHTLALLKNQFSYLKGGSHQFISTHSSFTLPLVKNTSIIRPPL
jgi:hypothetical protein